MLIFLSLVTDAYEKTKLERLYKKYHRVVYYAAYFVLNKNHHSAEDAVQITYYRAWRNLDKIDEEDEAGTKCFLYTISKNVARTMVKRECRYDISGMPIVLADYDNELIQNEVEQVSESVESAEEAVMAEVANSPAWQLVKELDELSGQILRLRFISNLNAEEIAQILVLKPGTVRQKISRALSKMKKKMICYNAREAATL